MSINVSPSEVSESVRVARHELADRLEKQFAGSKAWYDFPTPQHYRDARRDGTNGFSKPVLNERARLLHVVGRDGHTIELRVIDPVRPSKGVWLHFHAGGFVIGNNSSYDPYLTRLSTELDLTIASVEYRLAPENPFPTGLNDAVDAALFALSKEGTEALGAPLRVLGGESAGGWYAVSVALALRDEYGVDVKSQIAAVCAGYGVYDLTYTGSVFSHKRDIILSGPLMIKFVEAGFGHLSGREEKA